MLNLSENLQKMVDDYKTELEMKKDPEIYQLKLDVLLLTIVNHLKNPAEEPKRRRRSVNEKRSASDKSSDRDIPDIEG